MPDVTARVIERDRILARLEQECTGRVEHMDYVLPTGEKINPANPAGATYYDKDQTAFVLFKMDDDRVFPTRVVTTFGGPGGHRIGDTWVIRHDQTNAYLGTYQVVGIHDFGVSVEGWVPDRKISHAVFK